MSSLKRRKYDHAPSIPPAISAGGRGSSYNSYTASTRPMVLLLARTCLLPLASAAPLSSLWPRSNDFTSAEDSETAEPSDPNLYVYLGVAVALVLLGGAFAGLTIALMGQDETYLQVIATSGDGAERKHAEKVLRLLKRGKHWVLVTLLLSNVITNETLPIVLDRSLGGGWPAVLSSTVLIVVFGEIAPQSVCVRYGLSIGAFCAPFVLALMWVMCPVAWPTAKLLDWLLGEDHGTMYKKAGLKTLVQLHKTLGTAPGERLMQDEVTIINSVLDLKDKPVGDIMTPMQDVFTMSADTVLDEKMMDIILSQGYSRIPIYMPDNSKNFIGMLLVKILITYDPEDAMRVRDFSLATLPETAPFTSCLDIINFFQEGKSHMVLVSDFPGHDRGALGVVTLEDVIEELIGEEIIDESDVFIDVHKAIRRLAPAPKQRLNRSVTAEERLVTSDSDAEAKEPTENEPLLSKDPGSRKQSANGPATTFLMRRKSSAASDSTKSTMKPSTVQVRSDNTDIRQHLRHLGPSNAANKPRATKYTSVKIKPGIGTIHENKATSASLDDSEERRRSAPDTVLERDVDGTSGGSDVVKSAGRDASDGTTALHQRYGTLDVGGYKSSNLASDPMSASEASQHAERHTSPPSTLVVPAYPPPPVSPSEDSRQNNYLRVPDKMVVGDDGESEADDSIRDLSAANSTVSRSHSRHARATRSGSITQTFVETGGMNKLVLEMTSSSEDPDDADSPARNPVDGEVDDDEGDEGDGNRVEDGSGSGSGNRSNNGGWLSNAGSGMRKKKKQKGKRKKGSSNGS